MKDEEPEQLIYKTISKEEHKQTAKLKIYKKKKTNGFYNALKDMHMFGFSKCESLVGKGNKDDVTGELFRQIHVGNR